MNIASRLADLVLARRALVIVLALIVTAVAGLGAQRLRFSMEYRDFFGGHDPRVAEFDDMQRTYAKSDNILIVLAPESGEVFTRETLEALAWLTDAAWKLPYASRVDSITNYQNSSASEDEIAVEDLAAHPEDLTGEQIAKIRQIALDDVLLVDRMISRKGHTTGVNVTFRVPGINKEAETRGAVDATRELTRELRSRFPEIAVFLSGTLTISHAFYEATYKDLVTLIPLMVVMLALFLAISMRSVWGAVAAFSVVGGSTLIAFGIGGLLGMRLTPPAAAAAPIIMTLAIADCVHLFATYAQRVRAGVERIAAMRESILINFGAVFLTSITTVVGFATMNFAQSPPFHDLGNLVVIGVSAAYVLAMVMFPAMVTLRPFKPRPVKEGRPAFMERYADFSIRYRTALLAGALGLCAVLAAFVPRNELNDEFLKYFDQSVQFRRDNDFITRELTGVYQFLYSIPSGAPEGVTDPEYLRVVDEFAQWFRSQPEVWHVDSLTDVLKRVSRTANGDDPAYYRLPRTREEAGQYLLLFEMSLPVGLDLNDSISVDRSSSRFTVGVHTLPARQLLELEKRADDWLRAHAPEQMHTVATGPTLLFAHIGMGSIGTGLIQAVVAALIISGILLFALRSVKFGALSLVPNLVPAIAAFGVWALIQGQINMALATVSGMALGIIVDDTIHLLTKYLHARRTYGMAPEEAVRFSITQVGGAVVATSVTLIVGFLMLTPSPFVLNWGMGLLTAITLFFAMIFDLTMLPGLLLAVDKEKRSEAVELALSEN